ncbi:Uncharacterized protein dnm_039820 [Desulfonema magnum]|uniref:Uncharacterized protein n=1 Tax=Desulfonema magnum TaxID=45655 RepID=A0A975GPI4_9BACT|nr:Uncharacterized protein dnm_039820 [Desulfonema magnum]
MKVKFPACVRENKKNRLFPGKSASPCFALIVFKKIMFGTPDNFFLMPVRACRIPRRFIHAAKFL